MTSRLLADENVSHHLVAACRKLERAFPIEHIARWREGAFLQLKDPALQRQFFTSDNVKLELLPKPTFERRRVEVEFYREHFNSTVATEPFSAELGNAALALAGKYGLSAGDALNLAAAVRQGVNEFVTSDLPGKPIFRVTEIRGTSVRAIRL